MAQTLHDYFKTKYTADVVGLYGGQSQHGSPVKPPLVDALGRPVPEEYREAYELLAKDERRVCVTPGPTSIPWGTRRLMWTIWERTPGRDGAPCVEAPEMTHFQQAADGMSIADAARLALAMEAERLGKTEPANDDAIAEAAEARRAAAEKPADPMQGRTKCPCCGGPGVSAAAADATRFAESRFTLAVETLLALSGEGVLLRLDRATQERQPSYDVHDLMMRTKPVDQPLYVLSLDGERVWEGGYDGADHGFVWRERWMHEPKRHPVG